MKHLLIILLAIILLPQVFIAQVEGTDISAPKPLPKRPGKKNPVEENSDQDKTLKLDFEWLEPRTGQRLEEIDGKFQVRIRINGNQKLERGAFSLVINGDTGSKADEISLRSTKNGLAFILLAKVSASDLDRETNQLRIKTKWDDQPDILSPPLNLSREGNQIIRVLPDGPQEEVTLKTFEIIWMDPDPVLLGDQPMTSKVQELKVRFRILAPRVLLRDDISFAINKVFQPLSPEATLKGNNGRYTVVDVVTLNENILENTIQLHIRTPDGIKAVSIPLRVNFASDRPNLYVLSIGTKTNLAYTIKDAEEFAGLYENQGGLSGNKLFRRVQTDKLLGPQATASEIRGTVEELLVKMGTGVIQPTDLLILFISSHGFIDDRTREFRIQGDDYDAARSRSTSISYERDILNVLQELPCKKLLFIDACHSGTGVKASLEEIQREIDKLNSKKEGLTVIVSSKENEASYEDIRWQNGAFTQAIIVGLNDGQADNNKNGIVTINELFEYVSEAVPKMVGEVKGKPQHPRMLNDELGNVSIYVTDLN